MAESRKGSGAGPGTPPELRADLCRLPARAIMPSFKEEERLNALRQYSILDTLPQRAFDEIAELASMICDTPIAQVCFVDAERQWIKASRGLEARESPRSHSLCAHTIYTSQTLVVEDASLDPRFRANPLVLGAPFIRAYAGAPILDANGFVLGTVCAIDSKPHAFTDRQLSGLASLARQVITLLEQRKLIVAQEEAALDAHERSESSLRATAERLWLAQEAGRIVTWEWDLESDLIVWNGESAWIYGRPASELRTLADILPYIHPDDASSVMDAVQPARTGAVEYRAVFRTLWPDGSTHWTQAFGKPVLDAAGKPVRIVGLNMDITARKLGEEALLQGEKLAAVGRLASSIAHEINNPLESVMNLLFLARTSDEIHAVRDYLAVADGELRRVSEIANQTLRFHKQATRPQQVLCGAMVQGVLAVQQSRIHNAHVRVELEDRTRGPVLCFEGEVRQVVSNLVMNAVDAMQTTGGGRLILRARDGRAWEDGRAGMVLTIADSGPGIPREHVARIFDAFFTTKGIGGTGLGLWISKEIMDRHRGSLRMRSSQSPRHHGSVFRIFLPFEAAVRDGLTQATQG